MTVEKPTTPEAPTETSETPASEDTGGEETPEEKPTGAEKAPIVSSSKRSRPPYKYDPNKITLRFLFANRDGLTVTVECTPKDTIGEVKGALLSVWPEGTNCRSLFARSQHCVVFSNTFNRSPKLFGWRPRTAHMYGKRNINARHQNTARLRSTSVQNASDPYQRICET